LNKSYILAIDEGTTGANALLVDGDGNVISKAYREIHQVYPQPGWVEQDPQELFRTSLMVARQAIETAGVPSNQVTGIGVTGQRETTIVWERRSGKPVSNAVVWQCRRTATLCEDLLRRGLATTIRTKTGLPIDPYFSATKLRWILDHIQDGQKRAEQGELLFGTVDSWLVWNFTGGRIHSTDYTNASRTQLFNIHTLQWDKELLAMFDIPETMLAEVKPSSHIYGETAVGLLGNYTLPIAAIAGDQQASLFGQACFKPGQAKNTYGTGSFVMQNTGSSPVLSKQGLVTTIAWGIGSRVTYAMEGSIFVTGAAVQWLRDGLKIIKTAAESEVLANTVADNGGVYFVPALTGLGAPYWDMYARGTIVGLTRGTTAGHLARATLESIAYQARDVVETMQRETGLKVPLLRVDGGATANKFLMQFQADILGLPIQCSAVPETTGLGAAYLAGLALGLWKSENAISRKWQAAALFEPLITADQRQTLYHGWQRAIGCARAWSTEEGKENN
jgi:glycerol kinase